MTDRQYIEPSEALFSLSFLTIKSSLSVYTFSLRSDSEQDFNVFPFDYAATVFYLKPNWYIKSHSYRTFRLHFVIKLSSFLQVEAYTLIALYCYLIKAYM